MKTKEHRFIVTVKTTKTKADAKTALLCSFGCRQPDGCEFTAMDHSAFLRRQHARIMKSCNEARRRMNNATPEERAELEKKAREIIDGAAKRGANVRSQL